MVNNDTDFDYLQRYCEREEKFFQRGTIQYELKDNNVLLYMTDKKDDSCLFTMIPIEFENTLLRQISRKQDKYHYSKVYLDMTDFIEIKILFLQRKDIKFINTPFFEIYKYDNR